MSEELNPVAWMFRSEDGRDCVSYTKKCADEWSAKGEVARPLFLIPEGYALVPIEPTDEMINAACNIGNVVDDFGNSRPLWKLGVETQRRHEYKSMIKAAQESK